MKVKPALKGIARLGLIAALGCPALFWGAPERPNIILLMSDDQGFVDVGYNSNNSLGVQTPNIDRMAREGIRFGRFYACPNCSPTRASVLTGRHPFRAGVFNPSWAMDARELTIAHVLERAGYNTAHFGKWHLGSVDTDSPYNPGKRGFSYYLSNDQHFNLNPNLSLNGVERKYPGEGSEVIVEEAIKYIDGVKDEGKPFFLAIWYGSPHGGFEALPQDAALYEGITEEHVQEFGKIDVASLKGYLAEITAMDRSIGTLREALKERSLDGNTLVLFNSDNGNGKFEMLDDLRGGKGSVWEGGLRVPAVAVWPDVIKEPFNTDAYVATWDIMPTLMDIAGVAVRNRVMDGVSMYPLLQGEDWTREKPLSLWFYSRGVTDRIHKQFASGEGPGGPKGAASKHLSDASVIPASDPGWVTVIDGKWKLHKGSDARRKKDAGILLYDVLADPGETRDVAAQHPETVARLEAILERWRDSVVNSIKGGDYNIQPEIAFE